MKSTLYKRKELLFDPEEQNVSDISIGISPILIKSKSYSPKKPSTKKFKSNHARILLDVIGEENDP